jgi:hypothetical protein
LYKKEDGRVITAVKPPNLIWVANQDKGYIHGIPDAESKWWNEHFLYNTVLNNR